MHVFMRSVFVRVCVCACVRVYVCECVYVRVHITTFGSGLSIYMTPTHSGKGRCMDDMTKSRRHTDFTRRTAVYAYKRTSVASGRFHVCRVRRARRVQGKRERERERARESVRESVCVCVRERE